MDINQIKRMITVKVTLEDGNNWTTRINATLEGAMAYFLGQWFHSGPYDEDKHSKAVKVELI
tara:strand:+ start:107 stop:292 length:186 start_codon:yes stop_codon:yes gene_type:complete